MQNSLTIQDVLSNPQNYNLAIPFVESQQINPYYKLSVSRLYVKTDVNASEIFKVGSRGLGNNKYENVYSLTKPFLQRLATEAGIQFAPGSGDVIKMDENTWKASAFGALRLPDGSVRTSNNFKVIDLLTEERKYLLAYKEKAVKGITEKKAANDAATRYDGKWQGETFIIAEKDREKYIDSSLLEAMAQLRSNAPQKAATGAILRVIRDLLGIKGMYSMEELKRPFAVARMSFSPDYNDPLVKQMMLQQCMQSVGNLFGNTQPVMQTISIPKAVDSDDGIDMIVDPDVEEGNHTTPMQEQIEDRTQDFACDKCGSVIPEKVWDYSVEKMGMPLCYKCQKLISEQQRQENAYHQCHRCGSSINEKVYEYSINKFGRPLCMKCQKGAGR